MFVIRFNTNPPTYYDGSKGDPGRTTKAEEAKKYGSDTSAYNAADQLWRRYGRLWSIVRFPLVVQAEPMPEPGSEQAGPALTREELLRACADARLTDLQLHAMVRQSGPYDIDVPTTGLIRLAEILSGRKFEH